MNNFLIYTFYKFIPLNDYELLKPSLLSEMQLNEIKGTIILASEGINATISAQAENLTKFMNFLRQHEVFSDIKEQKSYHHSNPFKKAKVKLRKEIVTLGLPAVNPTEDTGKHVEPEHWNELLKDEKVMVIDTRNHYEIMLGSFRGAINPSTINFRDLPQFVAEELAEKKDQKIAMYCTGGIRCEKSTAYLKNLGYTQVFQLRGGILNYLNTIPKEQSLWQGDCFVFDDRVAVNQELQSLEEGSIDKEWKNKHRNAGE